MYRFSPILNRRRTLQLHLCPAQVYERLWWKRLPVLACSNAWGRWGSSLCGKEAGEVCKWRYRSVFAVFHIGISHWMKICQDSLVSRIWLLKKKANQNSCMQNRYKILKCSTCSKNFVYAGRDLHVVSLWWLPISGETNVFEVRFGVY